MNKDMAYWDKRYKVGNSGAGSYGKQVNYKIQQIKKVSGITSILDVGFGDLNMGLRIASLFPMASYLGLDISEMALQKARTKNLGKRFSFKLMENSIFLYQPDLVICLDVLFHITRDKDYGDMLKSLKQSWKKHLFLTAYKDECVNLHIASHMNIRKFDPLYFSKDYERTLIPLGNKNIHLYYFRKGDK